MPYLAPTQYQDRRALMADTDAQELRNDLATQANQRNQMLRQIYQSGREPTVQEVGSVDPGAALDYQNDLSLQSQRETDNQIKKQNALKGIMTKFREAALQRGFDPNRPETQQVLEDLKPAFAPYIESVTGQKVGNEPVSWQHVIAISDITPGEAMQQEAQYKRDAYQQQTPYEVERARLEAEARANVDLDKNYQMMPMQEARDRRMEDYKLNAFEQREKIKNEQVMNKPLPPTMMKAVTDAQQKIGETESVKADILTLIDQIDTKQLDFGALSNIKNKIANRIGLSTNESIALDNYDATLKQLQNTILNVAKGPQTDQDAVRAFETLVKNPYNSANVKSQLKRIEKSLERTANIQGDSIKLIYENVGKQAPNLSSTRNQPSALNDDIPEGWTDEDEAEYQRYMGGQ